MTQPLEALLARVERATDGSDELDLDTWGRLLPGKRLADEEWRFSRSLDAALALVARLLPGWRWLVASHGYDGGKYQDGPGAKLFHPLSSGSVTAAGYAKTPALALLAALLRALISQQKTAQGEGV